MYKAIQHLHSYWAYLVLLMVLIAVVNALIGLIGKRSFVARDFRIALFTLIVTHLQLLIGLIIFFISPKVGWFNSKIETGTIMKNEMTRLFSLEHPLMMIIAIILITIGYSRQKKKLTSRSKFFNIFLFYTIALILMLAMIPWNVWM